MLKENFNEFELHKKIRELEIQIESLDFQVEEFLEELKVTPEQLSLFIEDPSNFTEESWEQLQELRDSAQKNLAQELACIPNPRKSRKTFVSQGEIASNWMFVK